ncbi:MAG: hypothetical protein OES69_16500 [Myxococcales bacterium]|nr:hypothetical protein [Myxococcales bacterium]
MPNEKILLVAPARDGAPSFIENLPFAVCNPGNCPWPFPENLRVLLVDGRVGAEMCIHLSRRAKLETPRAIRILYHASESFLRSLPMNDHAFTLALPEDKTPDELHAIVAAVLERTEGEPSG